MKTIVIKIGGSTLGEHDTTIEDIVDLQKKGMCPVVVHGGGKKITEWLDALGVATTFKNGLRKPIEQVFLNDSLERPGSVLRVKTHISERITRLFGEFEFDLAQGKLLFKIAQLNINNGPYVGAVKRMKENNVVYAV